MSRSCLRKLWIVDTDLQGNVHTGAAFVFQHKPSDLPMQKATASHRFLIWRSFRPAFARFRKNDPLRMAGATAFFTTFALPPIVFILAQAFGLFLGKREVGKGLIGGISNTLGPQGASQVRIVIRSILHFSNNWYVIIVGVLFLIFVATTLFMVIRNSLNQVWQIGIENRPGFYFILINRFKSLIIILITGVLFLTDLTLEGLEVIAGNYVDGIWTGGGSYFRGALGQLIGLLVVSTWFTLLFRFLADGHPRWKAALAGGIVTGILFTIGRWVLRVLLVNSNIGVLYGTAGSFVLLLLFVFYSSFILYYGACFIREYSSLRHWEIKPGHKAYRYRIQAIPEEPGEDIPGNK